MLLWQPEFQSNQPENLSSLSLYLMVLYMKFYQIRPNDFKMLFFKHMHFFSKNLFVIPCCQLILESIGKVYLDFHSITV